MRAPELTKDFRPITRADHETIREYYPGHFQNRQYPRMYLSLLVLTVEPGHKATYFWGTVQGCLCLVKRKFYVRTPLLQLVAPPISKTGDVEAEKAVLAAFLAAGVSVQVSDEDLTLYGIDPGTVTPATCGGEFIYQAGTEPTRQDRYYNRLTAGIATFHNTPTKERLAKMARDWGDARGKTPSGSVGHYDAKDPNHNCNVVEAADGTYLGFSLCEQLAPGKASIVTRYRNYDPAWNRYRMGTVLHGLDLAFWPPGTLITMGAGRTPGARAHKAEIHPVHILGIHVLRSPQPVTAAEWRGCCVGGVSGGILDLFGED